MSTPQFSGLDANQVLRASFDDSTQALKTTAQVTLPSDITVSITDELDSVAVGNGSGQLLSVNSDGSINVNVVSNTPSFPQETLSTYSEVDSVAAGGEATVLTYTVPSGQTLYLNKVLVSSDQIAQMDLQFNGDTNARKRLSYTLFNETFDYSLNGDIGGYKLVAGTVITVIGTNLNTQNPASFNATLQGVQQ